ncbi:tripartite tricarboxylate transporter TctB family protein [Micromonospora pisi]|uniref:tripartite tricarboxylate transporter TctB family protein n=1 Tax=Micromonospora pisi TaxID=589240 RepID=UPI00147760F1|nr:tripartite tricarboxylate transporter TctB family protein [Micromonospora pisi]
MPTTETSGEVDPRVALPRAPWGPRILGVVLLLAGAFLCWTAYDSADGDFSAEGPWLAPLVVTAGWVVLAAWYLVSQFVRSRPPTEPTTEPADTTESTEATEATEPTDGTEPAGPVQWLTPALLGAALLGYVFALEPLGFVLASALFFVAAARILGSHHWIRDVLVAVPLVVAIYLGFTQLLEISLPAGVMPL